MFEAAGDHQSAPISTIFVADYLEIEDHFGWPPGAQPAPMVPFTSMGCAPPMRPTKERATASLPRISAAPSSRAVLSTCITTEGSRYRNKATKSWFLEAARDALTRRTCRDS